MCAFSLLGLCRDPRAVKTEAKVEEKQGRIDGVISCFCAAAGCFLFLLRRSPSLICIKLSSLKRSGDGRGRVVRWMGTDGRRDESLYSESAQAEEEEEG